MIDKAILAIKKEAQRFIVTQINASPTEEIVHLTPVVDEQGKIAIPPDSIGLSLLNIQEDRVNKSQTSATIKKGNTVGYVNPSIRMNLHILFAANFSDYTESLKIISSIIACFQAKSLFTPRENPELDPGIEKLILELQAPNWEQLNYLWGMIGCHYLPSVFYKIRFVSIQEEQVTAETSAVTKLQTSKIGAMGNR